MQRLVATPTHALIVLEGYRKFCWSCPQMGQMSLGTRGVLWMLLTIWLLLWD